MTEKGYPCKDFGTYSTESCDYADYAHPLALAIEAGECGPGVAICGSGEGISMTLNKHQGIRAALCWIPEIAHLSRQHNDANVLVMFGRQHATPNHFCLTGFTCSREVLGIQLTGHTSRGFT